MKLKIKASDIEFFNDFGWRVNDYLYLRRVLKKIRYAKDTMAFHSGGGCLHYLIRLEDDRVLSVNFESDILLISTNKWKSLNDYLNVEEDEGFGGFGWCDGANGRSQDFKEPLKPFFKKNNIMFYNKTKIWDK